MAILDTFYMMFKTNSDEVRDGLKNAEHATQNFEESVALADRHVAAAGAHIAEVFENVAIRIASAFAIEKLVEFTFATAETNAKLQETSERIGVAVEDLGALQSAAARFGGSADGVTQSLDFLNRGMADIAVKGKSRLSPFFDELKIKVLDSKKNIKPLLEVYGEMADKFQKMTAQQRAGYGEKFGIDQGLILALAEGRRGFEDIIARQKEMGVATAEDAEQADKFEKKLHDLGTVFRHISTEIVSAVLPAISAIVDGVMAFVHFLEEHRPLVEGFFIGIGGIIVGVYTKAVIRAIAATAALIVEWLLIPALIAAVAVAFALAYDDVKNFLAGNKSVIGELTKRWPIVGEVVRTLAKDIGAAWDWIVSAVKGGVNLVTGAINLAVALFTKIGTVAGNMVREIVRAWGSEFPGLAKIINGISDAIAGLIGWLVKAVEWFGKMGLSAVKALPKALAHAGEYMNSAAVSLNGPQLAMGGTAPTLGERTRDNDARIAAMYGGHTAATLAGMQRGQEQVRTAAATPIAAIGRAGDTTTHHKTVNVNAPITVNAAAGSDPKAIAGAIGDHISDHVRKAINAHDDGVER